MGVSTLPGPSFVILTSGPAIFGLRGFDPLAVTNQILPRFRARFRQRNLVVFEPAAIACCNRDEPASYKLVACPFSKISECAARELNAVR